jgi:hypothetical protein
LLHDAVARATSRPQGRNAAARKLCWVKISSDWLPVMLD